MLILVAGSAGGREPKIRPVGVIDLQRTKFILRLEGRFVAFLAGQTGVLPFQRVSGFAVIKFPAALGPANDLQIPSRMFRVATDAILGLLCGIHNACMIPPMVCDPAPDRLVALQTLELRPTASDGVAGGTFRQCIQ